MENSVRKYEKDYLTGGVTVVMCYVKGITVDNLKILSVLDESDVKSAMRYVNEDDKVLHLVSAFLKRKYVGEWTVDKYGKPVSDHVYFNLSHCKGVVVIALAESPVGVDVENVRQVDKELIEYVSSDVEREKILSDEDFFKVWTAKESLVKAQGQGLNKKLKEIPAFPLGGEKTYLNEKYFCCQTQENEFIITVTQKGKPFELKMIKEQII